MRLAKTFPPFSGARRENAPAVARSPDDPGSFMSRANSIVAPDGKLDIAMQLILAPRILKLVERRRRAI
jgi:hypothetical protein